MKTQHFDLVILATISKDSELSVEGKLTASFEEKIKRLVFAFHSVGAFGYRPNSYYYWEHLWRTYIENGILPQEGKHPIDWREKLPFESITSTVSRLEAENAILTKALEEIVDNCEDKPDHSFHQLWRRCQHIARTALSATTGK